MNAPKLKFEKPRKRHGNFHLGGHRVIRFGFHPGHEHCPGRYFITDSLEAWFLPFGGSICQEEFVGKVKRDEESLGDREADRRRRGRFLWTPCAVQRSLVKLYAVVRKDWEARCTQETAK